MCTRPRLIQFVIVLTILFSISSELFASYEEALELYSQNKYEDSLKILAQELNPANDMSPDSPNYKLRFLAAHSHWKLGNAQSVISHLKRCIEIQKDNIDPYIDLSLFYYEKGYYRDSEVTAYRGLKIKESPMFYYILGKIALKRSNYWRAKELFEKTNSLSPDMYISYNALGMTLMYLRKYSEANTAFSVARAIKTDSYDITNNLALSYEAMKDFAKAKEFYLKASNLTDDKTQVEENIARVDEQLKAALQQ